MYYQAICHTPETLLPNTHTHLQFEALFYHKLGFGGQLRLSNWSQLQDFKSVASPWLNPSYHLNVAFLTLIYFLILYIQLGKKNGWIVTCPRISRDTTKKNSSDHETADTHEYLTYSFNKYLFCRNRRDVTQSQTKGECNPGLCFSCTGVGVSHQPP